MKVKTINAVLTKKVRDWIGTLPEEMREQVMNDTIVTGGCIASMLLREKVNDFDVYFRSRDTVIAVAQHYVNQFLANRKPAKGQAADIFLDVTDDRVRIVVKSAGIAGEDDSGVEYGYFEGRPPAEAGAYVEEVMDIEDKYEEAEEVALETEGKYRPVFLSTNAITLQGRVQVILRFWGEPDAIHTNYDFVHCTNYWTKRGVVLRQDALESLLTKELRYVGSKYPVCSVIRIRKFIARGWTINAGQIVKMCFQISKLDMEDLRVLEDQLTGVDVAYFMEVVRLLKEKDEERVDSAYLLEIIERMF